MIIGFLISCAVLIIVFWLLPWNNSVVNIFSLRPDDREALADSLKQASELSTMLVTFTSGQFVVMALAVRRFFSIHERCPVGHLILIICFAVGVAGSLFMSVQIKLATIRAFLAPDVDIDQLASLIGVQAWCVAFSGAAMLTLTASSFLTFRDSSK
jgi:hypothetical protein